MALAENKVPNAKTRVLLVLWALGGLEAPVAKGKLQVTRTGEKASDYDDVLKTLRDAGAIALNEGKNGKIKGLTLQQAGYALLAETLQTSGFEFEGTQIGDRKKHFLLKY